MNDKLSAYTRFLIEAERVAANTPEVLAHVAATQPDTGDYERRYAEVQKQFGDLAAMGYTKLYIARMKPVIPAEVFNSELFVSTIYRLDAAGWTQHPTNQLEQTI